MGNNNLLFIGVGFHDFDNLVICELSKRYNVVYINSRDYIINHVVIYKLLSVIAQRLVIFLCETSIKNKLKSIQTPITKLFVIKGEYLNKEHLNYLDNHFEIEKKVIYLWDSWANHSNLEEITPYFNEIYSFDSKDCRERRLKLRPLFYFKDQVRCSQERKYDVSFVGGNHTKRYAFLRKMKQLCVIKGWKYSFHLLIGRVDYYKYRHRLLFSTPFLKEDADILIDKPLSYLEYVNIVSRSKVVIDMQASGQTGLTMRTIEALAMGARLITTNNCITEYKDIPSEAYLVVNDMTSMQEIEEFISGINCSQLSLPDRYESSYALSEMI